MTVPSPLAKQMAALTAANQARIAQNTGRPALSGGNSGSYVAYSPDQISLPPNFQMSNNYHQQPFLDNSMHQQSPLRQRQAGFLNGIATLMVKRGTPLPPSLTGVSVPNYDPTNSIWSIIEPSEEVGAFKLAGKDVDLFKLWGLVFQHGGSSQVTASGAWGSLLRHFDLPEHFPEPQANNSTSVALMLSQYYNAILAPFEEIYKKNLQDQQKKGQLAQQRQGPMPGQQFQTPQNVNRPAPGMPNMPQHGMRPPNSNPMMPQGMNTNNMNQYAQMAGQSRPSSSQIPHQVSLPDSVNAIAPSETDILSQSVESNLLDQDFQGIKRKHDQDERDLKRARQKTDPPETNPMISSDNNMHAPSASQSALNANANQNPRQQLSRRKIEYVPLAREVHSYGGRDLQAIDQEWNALVPRRPLRDVHDWGTVDIECLCMSIRSRLSIELSYALTTFTVLSTMRGQTPGSGFPISQCPDLLEDILDLVEELAFSEPEETPSSNLPEHSTRIYTNKELVALVQDTQCRPFAVLEKEPVPLDTQSGPHQRPANIILAVINVIRNLSSINENADYFAHHARLIDILLRLCLVKDVEGKDPSPVAQNISLSDLLIFRKEILNIFMGMVGAISLSTNPANCRTARRAFDLFASYLVDPSEATSPSASVQLAGLPPSPARRPSPLADMALEAFTRFSYLDSNRQLIGKSVPTSSLRLLLTMLVHRLPIVDTDFLFLQREYWLSFIEKVVMAIYSLVFLAPYDLKQQIKNDRSLGFKNVMLRLVRKILGMPNMDRAAYIICARRVIETLKLLDKTEELVDTSEPTMPVLSFGMGFADGDDSSLEKGTGVLGGNRDISLELLMMLDFVQDPVLFNELDSITRVECP